MKRRDFIKLSAGLGATMATTAPLSSAFAQTKMVLKAFRTFIRSAIRQSRPLSGWARS